ncbi:MAG: hypothetical protein IJA23_05815 [Clostridia bacterium]|nr:hypothetical protein [Clostridia bacterium]
MAITKPIKIQIGKKSAIENKNSCELFAYISNGMQTHNIIGIIKEINSVGKILFLSNCFLSFISMIRPLLNYLIYQFIPYTL